MSFTQTDQKSQKQSKRTTSEYRVCLHSERPEVLIKISNNLKIILNSCKTCKPLFESVGFTRMLD